QTIGHAKHRRACLRPPPVQAGLTDPATIAREAEPKYASRTIGRAEHRRACLRPHPVQAGLEVPATMNYEGVLAGRPDAVRAVDTALRMVLWNAAAEVLTERSARRAEGRYIKEVFSPDASVVRRLGEPLTTGESRSEAESGVERVDGRRVPVSIVTAPLCGRDGQVEAAGVGMRGPSRTHQAGGGRGGAGAPPG